MNFNEFEAGALFSATVAASWPWMRKLLVALVLFAAKKAGEEAIKHYVESRFKKKKAI